MGIVGKFSLETLKEPRVRASFRCPYCKSSTINVTEDQMLSKWEMAKCRKCKSLFALDCFNITVIRPGEDGPDHLKRA